MPNPLDLMAAPSLAIQVFMVNLEIPVVTTSLVAITSELNGFDKVSWIVSTYLLGYVGRYIPIPHLKFALLVSHSRYPL